VVQKLAHSRFDCLEPTRFVCNFTDPLAVFPGDLQETRKVFFFLRTAPDRKKVNDLNEEFGLALAGFSYGFNQLSESRQKAIVANAHERAAGNVADTGGFHDQNPRPSFSKASIPIEIVVGNKTVFRRPPGHHRRHPGAIQDFQRPDPDRLVKERLGRLVGPGPASRQNGMLDWITKLPHILVFTLSRRSVMVDEP
jgi:hypothetical protein